METCLIVAMQVAKAGKKAAVQVSGPTPKRQKVTEAEVCPQVTHPLSPCSHVVCF